MHIKSHLQKLQKENELTRPNSGRSLLLWYSIAASLLLLGLSFYWFWAYENYSTPALLAEYGAPYAAGPLRGEEREDGPLQTAMNAYASGDYQSARRLFLSLDHSESQLTESAFYTGHTLFQLGEYARSLPYYQSVIDKKDIRFQAAAEWYYLLGLLGDGQQEAYNQMVATLTENEAYPYYKQILQLQEDLQDFARQLPGIH